MKKTLLTTSLLLSAAAASHAALVFSESFDYTGGANLTANGWSAFASTSTTQTGTVGTGLTFGTGNTLAVSGGSADLSVTATASSFRNAGWQSADFGGSFTINSGTIWRSQLFQATSANAAGSGTNESVDSNIVRYDVAVDGSDNPNRIPGSTDNDTQERKFTLNGKYFNGAGALSAWAHNEGSTDGTSALTQGQTYLLISSYDFSTKGTTVWVFDETSGQAVLDARAAGTISAATLDANVLTGFKDSVATGTETLTLTQDDSIAINLGFNNNISTTSAILDEFRVGTDLNELITVVPEPSTYALLSGMLALGWVMIRRRRA